MSVTTLISFDYAIKYLLKSKGDYDIIEGFISALLTAQGYKPIKINALLESESNKETIELKKSIADLVVEDEDGNKYIVEIERAFTSNVLHKACFNTSRLVIDSISGNQDYTTIKKVFHITLMYFTLPSMIKPVYHGQTIFHEIDTANPIDVRIANQGFVMFENRNTFPEYFVISVPLFNDVINQEIDEWLYIMKHSEVKESFKSPYMQKVANRLAVLKMNIQERNKYFRYLKEAAHAQDVISEAELKGELKGRLEEKNIIAKNLLSAGLEIDLIVKSTGLSVEEVIKLKD